MSESGDNLHSTVGELIATVKHLDAAVRGLSDRFERSRGANWGAIGVMAAITVPTIGGLAWGVLQAINSNEARIGRIEARHEAALVVEQQRNNRIERELGAAQAVDALFMAGRLNLGDAK